MAEEAWDVVRLYHGTLAEFAPLIEGGVDPERGRPNVDFGRGFYLTSNREQAWSWAQKKARDARRIDQDASPEPAVLSATVRLKELAALHVVAFALPTETSGFGPLIRRFRISDRFEATDRSVRRNAAIDVTIGPVVKNVSQGTIYVGYDQYAFHTPEAVGVLEASGKLRRTR